MIARFFIGLAGVFLIVVFLNEGEALAQEEKIPEEKDAQIQELKRAIILRDQILRNMAIRLKSLEQGVEKLKQDSESPNLSGTEPTIEPADTLPTDQSPSMENSKDQESPDSAVELTEEDKLIHAAFQRALISRGGLLLPEYVLEVEPSLSYFHSSSDSVVIDGFTIFPVLVVGDIFSQRIRRDTLLANMTFRMGLPWDSQVEVRFPYSAQFETKIDVDKNESFRDGSGFGDIELALSHQVAQSKGWVPDTLFTLRWKSTTGGDPFKDNEDLLIGTGFNTLNATLTMVKVSDPVVFFGGLNYSYNIHDTKSVGRVNPGDSIGFQLGMALSLNLDSSINFGYSQTFTSRTSVNGVESGGTQLTTGLVSLGASYILDKNTALDFAVGIGISEDAPDIQLTLAVPIRFFQ